MVQINGNTGIDYQLILKFIIFFSYYSKILIGVLSSV